MTSPRNKAWRRQQRYNKGMRRLREDRAQHSGDSHCPCLSDEALHGRGYAFGMFADSPKRCSRCPCCGNPRRLGELTPQEQRFSASSEDC